MKKALFILTIAILAIISGYMIHKVSWIGRMGISLFYNEYAIFKSWWKSSLVVFVLFLLLYFLHAILHRYTKPRTYLIITVISILIAIAGLYYNYYDFRHDLSHRITGERFHIGFYLFWIGWILISVQFLFAKKKSSTISNNIPSSS